ncbi:ParB-like nuclease domain-containing protein [Nocardia terpenica]|uniref:Transcriptional regulator n=1 Tax=Nocardia terpenica TaxID=455432 RepID=A0A809QWT1_9NOCA|nr:ParB/RepB/Spo0J family partition protein [Nocardia terpenica]MBF6061291.1 ParB-like nuclease domain-containing protein [Nocardia terpenica]MBF6105480.1 ParB-like nuclease domain-containing protein [Nocardia terpenica]MBF6113050.1 ParB-like nuclease domain-containing protein [Nocardia terpenica]MBF6119180.1 ParB-like nuclease domain-containing protein [Nocardia terpenica]MBF6152828.1 ParB-like nuclease domain-containing protein [Nocardia terpenica]
MDQETCVTPEGRGDPSIPLWIVSSDHQHRTNHAGAITAVRIDGLVLADSPRLTGEDFAHVRALAETGECLPPILVHRPSMRVIDGAHRVCAARLRGDRTIAARFFDGTDSEAFILAVRMNIAHGLPLSLADRKAAAYRIIRERPQWSDRAIAATTGLSHKTVGSLRRSAGGDTQMNIRIGRDGRTHVSNREDGRRLASELITRSPEAPLREVAKAAGVSLGTAHDVRQRMRRGDDPIPARRHRNSAPVPLEKAPAPHAQPNGPSDRLRIKDPRLVIQRLRADPSLRFTEAGRALLRRLDLYTVANTGLEAVVDALPTHNVSLIIELAYLFAEDWRRFAANLENRKD